MEGINKMDITPKTVDFNINRRSGKIRINNPKHYRYAKVFIGIVIVLSIISIIQLHIEWGRLALRFNDLGKVFLKLSKFNFDNFNLVALGFAESVTVTILATLYSIINGLIIGALMAKNITPSLKLAAFLAALNSFIRAVPTTVWVLLILASIGFGPAPGIIGLSFHATAFFARSFSQSFEEIPEGTIEGLKAAGANRIQIFFSAILPGSITSLIAWSALRFEINFAESTILGIVGGGGIGYSIQTSILSYNYGRAGTSIVMIFLFSYLLELMFTAMKWRVKVV